MKKLTVEKLEKMFYENPAIKAEPVALVEVDQLEEVIGFKLPPDYKEFLLKYGGAIVGPYRIFGLRASMAMSNDEASALDITNRFREDGWSGTGNWLIISMDHSGNPIGVDKGGIVWKSDHDSHSIYKLADNFEEYLESYCLK